MRILKAPILLTTWKNNIINSSEKHMKDPWMFTQKKSERFKDIILIKDNSMEFLISETRRAEKQLDRQEIVREDKVIWNILMKNVIKLIFFFFNTWILTFRNIEKEKPNSHRLTMRNVGDMCQGGSRMPTKRKVQLVIDRQPDNHHHCCCSSLL